MKYILQVFNGSWNEAEASPEEIIRKIDDISSRIPVSQVIIGFQINAAAYRQVGAHLHQAGIRMILWLPVFSAVTEIMETDESLDIFGRKIITPEQQVKDGFVFVCPSSPHNIQNIKDIYEKYYSDCGFDGVFLDRIRTQSFTAGVSGVLSCGCHRCREAFLKRGVDISQVAERYEKSGDSFFDMNAWPMSGTFELKDRLAQKFFTAKEEIIAEAVSDLCRYFKERGLTVGLDLFSPLVSRFVGQNYDLITKDADFIKPMLYRKTEAPAGPGYEYALFKKHAPNARTREEVPMDLEFLNAQLTVMQQLPCEKYPGIEINYYKGGAETSPAYIEESLSAIKDHGYEGAVLCWNIMEAPEAHIEAVSKL